jgi:hypothetical protein
MWGRFASLAQPAADVYAQESRVSVADQLSAFCSA